VSQGVWEIITVFLLSTVKFVFGAVPLALGLGFSFFETVVITSAGGFVGVLFFIFFSDVLIRNYKKRKEKKHAHDPHPVPVKKFTRKNKTIVFIKRKFGLIGIALATPLLLSIPFGCFLAVRYFKNKQLIVAYMFGAILFWSISIASFKLLF
jgi:hypothetical protein